MDSIKKIILFAVPTSICNFRCHYCYLTKRTEAYQGQQAQFKYSPEEVARAFSKERVGGVAFMNFCADGETLLTKDIDLYIKALLEQGHYAEIVTNLTITPMLEKILAWDKELLKRVEFKCSFHYLELKKKNLLDIFAENVKKIWNAGASANIEVTPSDELIPYLDELKQFSLAHFGALPHLTIARDDGTKNINYLTDLSEDEYKRVWSSFDSDFWKFKREIFGKKQTGFCYAGMWSLYVNLATGYATQCYCGKGYEDVIGNYKIPLPNEPIARCPLAHCYNGHALLTLGLIPNITLSSPGYGDIRNRVKEDGTEWLMPEVKHFFNTKVGDNNEPLSEKNMKKKVNKTIFVESAKSKVRSLRSFVKKVKK